MATSWPQEVAWPVGFREHATQLGKYLRDALLCIERAKDQPVPHDLVKIMAMGALSLVNKIHNVPDFSSVHDALQMARTESKTAVDSTMQALDDIKKELKQAANIGQQTLEGIRTSHEVQNETKAAASESKDIGRTVLAMMREMKNADQHNRPSPIRTYASVAAGNGLAASIHNPLNQYKAPPAQVLREIVVNIRNPLTISSLRAMNPRSLKAHVDRAIEQSGNEHIENIKTVSTNQLKSGDLSIKTASAGDMEALRQFAEDWEHRLGNGATVRIPTYGVLVHGIRTNSMDVSRFEDIRDDILQENRPFIPNAGIKYIGWLTRTSAAKTASSVIIEFTRPQDANKIIDEGLIWQGEVFQCELYDRSCRLRQCFNCLGYGHIGTQCKATMRCGYCAQEHVSRECPTKSDKSVSKKCANCRGGHEAWSKQCATRKDEIAKVKAAYAIRPRYLLVPQSNMAISQVNPSSTEPSRKKQIADKERSKESQLWEQCSLPRQRGNEITVNTGSRWPQRTITPSRRALEALDTNPARLHGSYQAENMDVDNRA
ncbi:zinc knuckle domain protein [Metarhizium robertsii]|uniref:Zinc knuckle domain protein n=1 Tax=Metarhizium robertsii TaxID=568076 RepID=A0A014PIA2_9HYPO|nr:zinc knuckle domain protein [Metarhizium robertsii]